MWTFSGMGSKELSCFFPTQSRYSGASLRKMGEERIKQLKQKISREAPGTSWKSKLIDAEAFLKQLCQEEAGRVFPAHFQKANIRVA